MGDDPLTLRKGRPHPQSRGHRQISVGLYGIPSSLSSEGWHRQKYDDHFLSDSMLTFQASVQSMQGEPLLAYIAAASFLVHTFCLSSVTH